MRVLLYEFLTGGGLWSWHLSPEKCGSLLREGAAMISALAGDFWELPGVEVIALRDERLERSLLPTGTQAHDVDSAAQERRLLQALAQACDWSLLIAPELGGALLERCRLVESVGGRLLSPGSALIELASDKHATAEHLAENGLPVPCGRRLQRGERLPSDFPYPAVLKPIDGAGSTGIVTVEHAAAPFAWPDHEAFRLEELRRGKPASVATLCGPTGTFALPAAEQHLSRDGRFRYLGGRVPLDEPAQTRACELARRAVAALPSRRGYLGIDLLLGDDPADDVIMEINPRLTTSYCGLRRLCRGNLAAAMLAVAEGRAPDLSFREESVTFLADGRQPFGCSPA